MELSCDVLVVGGGPAGASLAATLSASGTDVIACEKARFPRDKLCGEFLSPDGIACIDRLGLRAGLDALGGRRIEEFLVTSRGSHQPLRGRLPSPALGLSRHALDWLLLQNAATAGAKVIESCRVISLSRADAGRVLARCHHDGGPLSIEARCIVDASGRLGGPRFDDEPEARPHPPAAVGVQQHRQAPEGWPARVELHAFGGGYVGLDAIESGRVTVCALAGVEALRRAGSPQDLFDLAARENAHFRERLERLGEPVGDIRTTAIPGARSTAPSRVLALGDASGMIDPLCGDGMAIALRSAELLAPLVLARLEGMSEDAVLARWVESRSRELRRRLAWGRTLGAMLVRPVAARLLVAAGRAMPLLAHRAVSATRGAA